MLWTMALGKLASYLGRGAFAVTRLTVEVALDVVPGGGQHVARRNAWAAMVRDNRTARQRREVDAFLATIGPVSSAHGPLPPQRLHPSEG